MDLTITLVWEDIADINPRLGGGSWVMFIANNDTNQVETDGSGWTKKPDSKVKSRSLGVTLTALEWSLRDAAHVYDLVNDGAFTFYPDES